MNQKDYELFINELPNVEHEENFGYSFFFVGNEHKLPFVSFADSDNEYDNVSNLDRNEIFRINIGVSKDSFNNLVNNQTNNIDYTITNTFLPHPHYSSQNYICILNPKNENIQKTKEFIKEAHLIASKRFEKKEKNK
ncbi:TPA: hypothetical protein I2Z89_RS13800 [Staphylococcus aureus]|nr:hypothetical protein [Staphylococcus aureus]HBI8768796.1 hypothetical protein [Staphylococcus aureus]HBI8776753.1 hypothetical protein [Staphylococcus aureus]